MRKEEIVIGLKYNSTKSYSRYEIISIDGETFRDKNVVTGEPTSRGVKSFDWLIDRFNSGLFVKI